MWLFKGESPSTPPTESSRPDQNDKLHQPLESNDNPNVTTAHPFAHRMNFQRLSKAALLAKLEAKAGQHNLTEVKTEDSSPKAPVVKELKSDVASRLSTRPLTVVRRSEVDMLHLREECYDTEKLGENELIAIPILPADEMEGLTADINLWYSQRRRFNCLFGVAIISSVILVVISIIVSALWYGDPPLLLPESGSIPGSFQYNIHMCGQFFNVALVTFGGMTFRLLPHTRQKTVIGWHVFVLMLGFFNFGISVYYGVVYHETFTAQPAHFFSLHSWLGLLTCVLLFASCFTGFLLLYYPSLLVLRSHHPAAVLTLMLCAASLITGVYSRAQGQMRTLYQSQPHSAFAFLTNISGVVTLALCIVSKLALTDFQYRRRPKPQWDVVVYRNFERMEEIYLDIHQEYESFEDWVADMNKMRLRLLREPHILVKGH